MKSREQVNTAAMDIQSERRRLLDAEGGEEDPTGLMSEQDAYLRSVNQSIINKQRRERAIKVGC